MTISSALNAAVTGLIGNASRMGVISDNIANSSTFGYKAAGMMFNSVVIGKTGSRYTAGGVTTSTVRDLTQQGALVGTNRWGDLAVSGPGFLPVRPYVSDRLVEESQQTFFTTTGSFSINNKGYLTTESQLALLGWKAGQSGSFDSMSRSGTSDLEPIHIDMNQTIAIPSKTVSMAFNLPSQADNNAERPLKMSLEYYDTLGGAREMKVEFQEVEGEDDNWTMTLKSENGEEIGKYKLSFSRDASGENPQNGKLTSITAIDPGAPTPAYPAYDAKTGTIPFMMPDNQEISLDIGILGADSPITQYESEFQVIDVAKDGAPAARLTSFEINREGDLVGYYENGESRVLYKIPLANMPNPDGLRVMDNQTYALTNESGSLFFWDSGTTGVGTILSAALEQSTTDVATELTNMIQTQRAYSSNAKVIQTVDDMLQETTNIKR